LTDTDKRDLEIEKVRLAWDYHKSSFFTMLTVIFSGFVAAVVILNAMVASPVIRLNSLVQAGVLTLFLIVVSYYLTSVSVELRKLVIETDRRIKQLESRDGRVEDLRTLCGIEKEPLTKWKEFEQKFPWGKGGIILLAGIALALIYLGFTG